MTDSESSAAYRELTQFFANHSSATVLLRVGALDYAAARCVLLNGMFEGLVLGAQAIEKTLKSYLLLNDPKRSVKALSHSLPRLLHETTTLFPHLPVQRFAPLVEKFRAYYQTRYPDNPDAAKDKTTGDVRGLDELIIFLSENMPCPYHVKYRAGIYPLITASIDLGRSEITSYERWIKYDNHALLPLLPRINSEHRAVMRALYPGHPRYC